jgi:hypothetical protein
MLSPGLSEIAMYAGQGEDAMAWAVQARQIPGDRIPAWYARRIDSNLVWVLVCHGEQDGVPELCDQLLAAARTLGDLSEQADALVLMAVAALRGGRIAAARTRLRESAEIAVSSGYPLRMIDILDQGGHLCAATGRPPRRSPCGRRVWPSARRPGWSIRHRRRGTASGRWPRPRGRSMRSSSPPPAAAAPP